MDRAKSSFIREGGMKMLLGGGGEILYVCWEALKNR